MSLDLIIFLVSAVVAVFGASMMIFQRNSVASVLYLILSLLAQAVLYLQLGALFMGAVLVLVYAGAIMILFLFVIMPLNLRGRQEFSENSRPISLFTKYLVSILLVLELVFIVREVLPFIGSAGVMAVSGGDFGSVRQVSLLLFTDYLYTFELTGVLLLVAIIAAVVISQREKTGPETKQTLDDNK